MIKCLQKYMNNVKNNLTKLIYTKVQMTIINNKHSNFTYLKVQNKNKDN